MTARNLISGSMVAILIGAAVAAVAVRIHHRNNPEPPTYFDVARCQRAILDGQDKLLIDYCRNAGRVSVRNVQATTD